MKLSNIITSVFLLLNYCVFGITQPEPEQVRYKIVRLDKNVSYYMMDLKKHYPPSYNVDVTLYEPDCNWLEWEQITSGDPDELYVEYIFTVKQEFLSAPDLRVEFQTTEVAIKNDNGNYGYFDPYQNTEVSEPPRNRRTIWIFQWDPCPSNNDDDSKIPQITPGLPENGTAQYTLFGEIDGNAVNTNGVEEIDYFRFMPSESSGQIYMAFPSGSRNTQVVVQLGQFGDDNFEVLNAVTNRPSNSGFKPMLEFENLTPYQTAYVRLSFLNYNNSENLNYKVAVFNCKHICETTNWKENNDIVNVTDVSKPIFISFNSINEAMSFQTSTKNTYSINFYNDQFESAFYNLSSQSEDYNNDHHRRYPFNGLENDKFIFIKLVINPFSDNSIVLRLSRLKPLILVHGIDASPRYDGDGTSFGSLRNNNTLYYDIRPYSAHDFPWKSTESIKRKYVGNGVRNGTLGAYITSKRQSNDLKATIVAHSAGCLMTYYYCQEHNNKFKNNVDNILFAAPPLLGSSLADQFKVKKWFSYVIKRTSGDNFDLIARGTRANWLRGNSKFKFPTSKTTVILGTRKYITINEVAMTSIDSIGKYKNYKLLFNTSSRWRLHFDVWYDVLMDTIEGIGEEGLGLEALWPSIISHSSELNKRNISDSAVGIYSACLTNNPNFRGIGTKSTYEIHSNIQKFSGRDNLILYEALRDRLSEIETEEQE
ncbi:hypothetical protein J6X96_02245 [bacterium]|nr:hypothetical protein [bacterium]